MREHLNCPNCGAPITNEVCTYCGTVFYDFVNLDPGKVCYIRMKMPNDQGIMVFKAVATTVSFEAAMDAYSRPEYDVTVGLHILPDRDDHLIKFYERRNSEEQL